MPLSRISFIMYLVHMNVENYILGLYPSNTSLNVTTGVSLYALLTLIICAYFANSVFYRFYLNLV